MNTLEEAIAEVKRAGDLAGSWEVRDFNCGHKWSDKMAVAYAAILNAVASGALIPKADAEMAVALAYQRAGDAARDHTPEKHGGMTLQAHVTGRNIEAAILALAPAEALAEVERMRQQIEAVQRAHMVGAERSVTLEDRAEAAEAEVARLQKQIDARDKELDYLNRRYIREIERNHELLSDVLRMEEALTAARRVVYQSSIDRTQPEEADAALRLIDAALTTPEKDTP